MRLLTAHKILISTAVVFFFGFGLRELVIYSRTDDPWTAASGLFYLLVAAGLGFYLKSLRKWVQ
jgi:hypothetical protein